MPPRTKTTAAKPKTATRVTKGDVAAVLASLERAGRTNVREAMGPRYGIHTPDAFGVMMQDMQKVAKGIGTNHDLALALWDTGNYEARMVASMIDDPANVTPAQMDHWCKSFDNWAICDTACFKLFDRTPHAFQKIAQWAGKREEFAKRAGFALLASVALHDKKAPDEPFLKCLPLIEKAADDERNFVKKGVSWALRGIGKRNAKLQAAATEVARRLAASDKPAARWIGKDALREFAKRKAR
jgi:3-methyladenine DNA glycosylase AlkD